MAKAIIDEQSLTDIADAIRAKNGSTDTYTPAEMATAIAAITGAPPEFEIYEITADTACASTANCKTWMDSLINQYAVSGTSYIFAYIRYIGESPVSMQFISVMYYSSQSPVSLPNTVSNNSQRWQSSTIRSTTFNNPSYDSVVNIGDKYRLVLVKSGLVSQ